MQDDMESNCGTWVIEASRPGGMGPSDLRTQFLGHRSGRKQSKSEALGVGEENSRLGPIGSQGKKDLSKGEAKMKTETM